MSFSDRALDPCAPGHDVDPSNKQTKIGVLIGIGVTKQ